MLCDLFFPNVLSAAAEGYLPCLTSCYQQIFTLLKSSVHTSVSPSHSLWSSEKWVLEYPYKGKEIFRVKVGVRYGEVCLTGREWQIKPTGSLSLHLRVDNAGLPISVHELHQFSGSIVEINVSFPSLCLSNTALSYLCQSVSFSDFLPRPGMLDEMSVCYQTGCDWKGRIYVKSSCSEVSLAVLLLHVKLGGLLVGFSCKDCSNKVCNNALQHDQWN